MRIREVSGGQFHWLMRQAGAHRSAVAKAEMDAGFSNTGYGVVKSNGSVIGLVTKYDYESPRYFVDSVIVFCEDVGSAPDGGRHFPPIGFICVPPRKKRVEIAIKDALGHPVYGPQIAKALADIEAGCATFS